jgi:hypothetical protein
MRSPLDAALTDLALTENVSPRGARIITKRARKAGDSCGLASLSGGFYVSARVVYCERLPNRNYCIGLELQESQQNWWQPSRAVPAAIEARSGRAGLRAAS